MSNSERSSVERGVARRTSQRRPAGVSRRRKKQLGFEPLEDRRVMSAMPLVAPPQVYAPLTLGASQSVSSDTLEGRMALLEREVFWQSLIQQYATPTEAVAALRSVPTDPLVANQWHLVNAGQQVGNPDFQPIYGVPGEDLNMAPVWNMGITGRGVTVAVLDSGVDMNHPDLRANIRRDLALDALDPLGDGNPLFSNPGNAHGTAVAGIIAAVANNGIGGAGIAPNAEIVPVRLIDFGQTEQAFIDAFRLYNQQIDVTNNSWGPAIPRFLSGPSPAELLAIRDSVIFGRGGLGLIHVFASGNSAGTFWGAPGFQPVGGLDSAAYDGWNQSRYVISVTGVDHDGFYNNVDGTHTGYPEISAAVLVAAPTGSNAAQNIAQDTGLGSGIFTTDLRGEFGYNDLPDPITGEEIDRDFLEDANYTSRFNGTSAASPMVTGVIALMLEANPNLTWRDVQEILVRAARQNAPQGVPANGFEQGHAVDGTQNTWIVNQMPVFHDPDPYFGNIPVPAATRLYFPTLDPNITANPLVQEDPTHPAPLGSTVMHYAPTPITMTNGAGYTVSMGRGTNGELIGYGHGAIDAEMAVLLSQQWHTKNQALPRELTFSTFVSTSGNEFDSGLIPAREVGNADTDSIVVPGGLGGAPGFIAYWDEFTTADPFGAPEGPENTRGAPIYFSVPENNAMSIESVEVKISLSGGTAAALDRLRILLISPDGTHSELNNFFGLPEDAPRGWQNLTPYTYLQGGQSPDQGDTMVWSFTSKRHWGERADDALVFNPATGLPIVNTNSFTGTDGVFPPGISPFARGQALEQGWQLHFENYGTTDFTLNGVEVVWHGSPINAQSQRVQGFVGIDENRDDLFNYSRVIQTVTDLFDDPDVLRFSEVEAVVDPNQEKFAGNVTVNVHRASDGALVDQFVTGHDGNFYFDLVPDDYIVSIDDPLDRVAQDDSITASGLMRKYQNTWRITPEHFRVWQKVVGSPDDTPVDANGVPIPWLDGNGETHDYGMRGINFLLDPGPAPPQQVTFSGVVYADANGDGAFNGVDAVLPSVSVFGDVNRNGQRDAGEIVVTTDADGRYTLVAPMTQPGVVSVGILMPVQWTATNPVSRLHTAFARPGDSFSGRDFYIMPPASSTGGGTLPGIVLGSVFNDVNGNGARETSETGVPNFTVYIDANNNGSFDAGDTSTTTNSHGAFMFTNVAPGPKVVRITTVGSFSQTTPAGNGGRSFTLGGGGTVSGLTFGVRDTAVLDYGDLPIGYGMTTAAQNGARHRKGVYFLGASVDGELNGNPTADANGDDNVGLSDEDGVLFGTITPGGTTQLTVTASRNNGYLKGWIDWNNDGDFSDANERLVFSGNGAATNNVLLNAGVNTLSISVPGNVTATDVYARFRYGEFGIDSLFGEAQTGEVEDYKRPVVPPAGPLVGVIPADFDQNGRVDGADFLTWQRNFGRTTLATHSRGNANGDGAINAVDLAMRESEFGKASQSASASAALLAAEETAAPLGAAAVLDGALASRLETAARGLHRPEVAARLREIAERIDDRFEQVGDRAAEALEQVADRLEAFRDDLDEALDQLFSGRRRPNLRPVFEAIAHEAADAADEAFAWLGRRGA